jgi:hypothetical protein
MGEVAMGLLTDYFREPDRSAVMAAMGEDLFSPVGGVDGFDGVQLKGVDPAVLFGRLIAAILNADYAADVYNRTLLYPPPDTEPADREAYRRLPPNSPWLTGPWVTELSPMARDALASLDASRVHDVAAVWATSEEFFGDADLEWAVSAVAELRSLAQRAVDNGELLYNWMSL